MTAILPPRDRLFHVSLPPPRNNMFVWIFHRISGVLLILLVGFQLVTGFYQASLSNAPSVQAMAALHKHAALNCLMVFLFIFHALYGLRTIAMDLGVKAERLLFWASTAVGLVLFGVFLALFFTLVAA
jgi:succinate dehydrogenase cytochrome b556 subunit